MAYSYRNPKTQYKPKFDPEKTTFGTKEGLLSMTNPSLVFGDLRDIFTAMRKLVDKDFNGEKFHNKDCGADIVINQRSIDELFYRIHNDGPFNGGGPKDQAIERELLLSTCILNQIIEDGKLDFVAPNKYRPGTRKYEADLDGMAHFYFECYINNNRRKIHMFVRKYKPNTQPHTYYFQLFESILKQTNDLLYIGIE
jgi:hypothetical protein